MTGKQLDEKIELEYFLYKDKAGNVDSLENFCSLIVAQSKILEGKMEYLNTQRFQNRLNKVFTIICWPVVRHYSYYPSVDFYDTDNELINIQKEMISQYYDCFDRLFQVVNQDNMNAFYGLAKFTFDKFSDSYNLVSSVRECGRNPITKCHNDLIEMAILNVSSFLNFFDDVLEREIGHTDDKIFSKK